MTLFRYFDAAGGLATLISKKMRFASPLRFNDPFELTPRVEKPPDTLMLERLHAPHIIEEYFCSVGSKEGLSREDSQKRYIEEELPKRFDRLRSDAGWSERALKLRWDNIGIFADSFRLLCCSHREDSILMWSHYAERHRGLVIEFDPSLLIPGVDLSSEAYDVRYRTNPPIMPALDSSATNHEESILRVMSTKALEWSYEEEVRILFPRPDGLDREQPHDQPFDPLCITRVIVGCYDHPTAKTYDAVNALANNLEYNHVRFQRAYLHQSDYRLVFADRNVAAAAI